MKYCVNIPMDQPLSFPDVCPFTGELSPGGSILLRQTKTLLIIPFLIATYHRYQTTTLQIPASEKFAQKATVLGYMVWASLLGGIGIAVAILFGLFGDGHDRIALLGLVGGPIVALVFKILRHIALRAVRLASASDGYAEVRFQSENYAHQFADLNRLAMVQS